MCNKTGYRTPKEAQEDIRHIQMGRRRWGTGKKAQNNRKMRIYLCHHCGLYHLTTQKPRTKWAKKNSY